MVRVKNDRVKPNLGGSGLIPGNTKPNYNALYGTLRGETHVMQVMEASPQVVDFFTSWIDSLSADVESAIDKLNEEETKPSPPVIDWVEESEDELPF